MFLKRFLKTLSLFMIPVVLFVGLFAAALLRSGELVPAERIEQAAREGTLHLFGYAYRDDARTFKQAVANDRAAEVLVLGTSRSMQLHGEFFETDSFYNAGGAVAYLSQAQVFLENMPADALPRRLILVLDQYFFNENWAGSEPWDSDVLREYSAPAPYYAFRRTMADYLAGKYSLWDVLTAPEGVYGMAAAGRASGFLPDGSYTYGTTNDVPEKTLDYQFRDSMRRINMNTGRFEYGDAVWEKSLDTLRSLLSFCKAHDIKVTAFMPPYAPSVYAYMQQVGQYGYIPAAAQKAGDILHEYGFEFFDFTVMPETNDEQYEDGFHGSDRVYAALCAHLARDSEFLRPILDEEKLTALFLSEGHPRNLFPA